MKQLAIITVALAVITIAVFGCLYIFGMMSYESALTNLARVVGAIVLLGVCSAVIALLMGGKKQPPQ